MIVLVSDTSVLIDLDRGRLLESIFSLPYEFAVPDVLFSQEMEGDWGGRLVALGLRIEEVSATGVRKALGYRSAQPVLSVPDSFALALAQERTWTLLTGDAQLRELATAERVECHGVLWLLDRMEELPSPKLAVLYDGLVEMATHPRCRLPKREITIRLERYRATIGGRR